MGVLFTNKVNSKCENKMRPLDIATNETLKFMQAHLSTTPARILEVGCGNGELAQRLQGLGQQIIGIDSSPEAVHEARRLGVDARVAHWPEFDDQSFDAILFTRSLHHIHHLDEAIEKAAAVLKPTGVVMVEDFAFDEIDWATVEWFYSILALLNTCGRLIFDDEDSFGKALWRGNGDFEIWHREHDHDLHPAVKMFSVLKNELTPLMEASAPYLYRYLCPLLEGNEAGYGIVSQVFENEKRLAQTGAIKLIGRRFVGMKK